tara:strand:- start:4185 stop:4757 length:573 start_codon:yes stop_codon:yes gene_type:complete
MGSCAATGDSSGFLMNAGYEDVGGDAYNYDYEEAESGNKVIAPGGVNDLYNKWTETCPFSLKAGDAQKDDIKTAESADDLINYSSNKDDSKRKYNDLMNEIYRRILVMKSFGVDSSMEDRDSSLIDTLNEKIKQQQRYTFSLLSKVLIFTFFVILVIATIMTHSKILYYITFSILGLMIVLNLTVMQNNI